MWGKNEKVASVVRSSIVHSVCLVGSDARDVVAEGA